jgi:hypothetical protein
MKMFSIILSIAALICAQIAVRSQNRKISEWNHLLNNSASKDYEFYDNDIKRICLPGQIELSARHDAEGYSTMNRTDVVGVQRWEGSGMTGDQQDIVVKFIRLTSAISRNPDSTKTPASHNFFAGVLVPGTHLCIGIQRQDSLSGKPGFRYDIETNRQIEKQTYDHFNKIIQINLAADINRMRTFVPDRNETCRRWSWEKFITELKRIIQNDNLEFNAVPLHASRYFEWTCGNELKIVVRGINFNY